MGLETIGLVASIGGTLVNTVGSIMQGNAAAKAAEYQAEVNRNNAKIAQQNAEYAANAGAARAQAEDFKTRAVLGTLEAAQGASGISTESESSRSVRRGQEQIGRLDAQTIMANAALQSRSYLSNAYNYQAEAGLNELSASNYRTAGAVGAFSSLLGGASSLSSKWLMYQRLGVV